MDGVERVEPAARLVDALGDEVGRRAEARAAEVPQALLGVRHRARVEPHVNEVGLAGHLAARGRHQEDLVHVRPVQVDAGEVLGAVVLRIEALILQGIGRHDAGRHRLLDLGVELGNGADADLLAAVLGAPDGQRRAPEAAAAQVPVLDVLEPLAEAPGARGGGLPGDLFVELHHLVLHGRGLDEPRVERIIEHGEVGAPAVRIAVHVLLDAERAAVGLHHHAKVDVEGPLLVHFLEIFLVTRFHIAACVFSVRRVDVRFHVVRVEVLEAAEAALAVHLGLRVTVLVNDQQPHDAGGRGHALVVGAEGRRDVHDAGTVLGRHVVARDDAERVAVRLEPRDQLAVADAHQLPALVRAVEHLKGHLRLGIEPRVYQVLGDNVHCLGPRVGIGAPDAYVVDVGADAEGGVRGQGPRRGGPGQDAKRKALYEQLFGSRVAEDVELHRGGRIAHVLVAAGLVELVRAEARAVGRRIRLDGETLVQQTFIVNLTEQVPQRLDVAVVVGDVRVVHVHPVADAVGQRGPLLRVLHHLGAARRVVFFHRDLGADVGLRDAELLLDAQLDRQAVRVPAGLALHAEARLGLVAAHGILDGTGHHVVDAGHAVRGRRALKEDELGRSLALLQHVTERILFFPLIPDFVARGHEVQFLVLGETHCA